jgi:hypothetical protein
VGYPNDKIVEGREKDTVFLFKIEEMAQRNNVAEAMNYSELKAFINREKEKGSGKIVAIIAGETLYQDRSGKLHTQTPCSATDPTVTHQLLALDGGPAALMLERFVTDGIYFVRIVFGYDPEMATVTLPDGEVSLDELEQQVAAERSERGLCREACK